MNRPGRAAAAVGAVLLWLGGQQPAFAVLEVDAETTGKSGGFRIVMARDAEATARAFQQALRDGDWDAALDLCTTIVQSGEKVNSSYRDDFFRRRVPIKELVAQQEFPICGISSRGEEAFLYELLVPVRSDASAEDRVWVWSVEKTEDGWRVGFPLLPVAEHLRREDARLAGQARRMQEEDAAMRARMPDIHTTLAAARSRVRVGEPVLVRLELGNGTTEPLEYDDQQVDVNGSMSIHDAMGTTVPYTFGPVQTAGHSKTLNPGQSAVLVEGLDLAKQYDLSKPGRYTVRFNGSGLMLNPGANRMEEYLQSNEVTVEVVGP